MYVLNCHLMNYNYRHQQPEHQRNEELQYQNLHLVHHYRQGDCRRHRHQYLGCQPLQDLELFLRHPNLLHPYHQALCRFLQVDFLRRHRHMLLENLK